MIEQAIRETFLGTQELLVVAAFQFLRQAHEVVQALRFGAFFANDGLFVIACTVRLQSHEADFVGAVPYAAVGPGTERIDRGVVGCRKRFQHARFGIEAKDAGFHGRVPDAAIVRHGDVEHIDLARCFDVSRFQRIDIDMENAVPRHGNPQVSPAVGDYIASRAPGQTMILIEDKQGLVGTSHEQFRLCAKPKPAMPVFADRPNGFRIEFRS